ncbi:MAG: GTPase HflX [Gammaproteobacteria bacterium]|nr:GTPase HflX [Gammaproteobacteria bacterium]
MVTTAFDGGGSADWAEFLTLVRSAGVTPAHVVKSNQDRATARFLVGRGKVDEIKTEVVRTCVDLVIFDHPLSASQERNLSKALDCRVIDRTTLILDIFAQRARSYEGKLQVELAQLERLSTRLIRGWTHLERQKGGIGLRGPGETQLETDRRLLRARLRQLQQRLARVARTRVQQRRGRERSGLSSCSLVGYTNSGKSTLFNRMTGSDVLAADQLFATLDPTLRRIEVPVTGPVVIADTVGFIRNLPTTLIAAFRATLEETVSADLLLHVVDASSPTFAREIHDVNEVLKTLEVVDTPTLMIYNKIDLMDEAPRVVRNAAGKAEAVWLSAATGVGCDLLLQAISERAGEMRLRRTITMHGEYGKLRGQLFAEGAVLHEEAVDDNGWRMRVEIPQAGLGRLRSLLEQEGVTVEF